MKNKVSIVIGLGVFLLLSTSSPARILHSKTQPPRTPLESAVSVTASDSAFLGALEGAANFCSGITAESAHAYSQLDQLFTSRLDAQTINQVRNGGTYENAYQQVTKSLKSLPAKQASGACNNTN